MSSVLRRSTLPSKKLASDDPMVPGHFRTEDADPLRDRADFRLLMKNLALPAESFAAAR